MYSTRSVRVFLGTALAVTGLAATMFAGTASAATVNKYAPSSDARDFNNSIGGWQSAVDHDGLCLPLLLCPVVTNEYVGSGGTGGSGDGFIQTDLGSLTGVGADSTGIFVSPSFKYQGAGGKAPDNLKFRMSRRADVASLLSVAGNTADYSVSLEKIKGGKVTESTEVIPSTTLAGAKGWTSIDPVNVDPASLDIGSTYRISIQSLFTNGAEVLPGGSADYDNVILRAMRRGGAGTVSEKQIIKIIKVALPGSVVVKNGKVQTRLKCQRKAPGKCVFRNLKLVSQQQAQTKTRKAAVGSGKKRTVGLKLRKSHTLRSSAKKKTALLTGTLKVGGKSRKISKRVHVRFVG